MRPQISSYNITRASHQRAHTHRQECRQLCTNIHQQRDFLATNRNTRYIPYPVVYVMPSPLQTAGCFWIHRWLTDLDRYALGGEEPEGRTQRQLAQRKRGRPGRIGDPSCGQRRCEGIDLLTSRLTFIPRAGGRGGLKTTRPKGRTGMHQTFLPIVGLIGRGWPFGRRTLKKK